MRALRTAVLLSAVAIVLAPARVPAASAAPGPKALLDAYLKAKKADERDRAWAAVESAAAPDASDVPALRAQILDALAKRGRRIGTGRETWFDEKADGWAGLYMTSGKGGKGLVLGLHGGGAGAGDCGQAASSFSGAIGSLGMRGVYPEVLRKTEYGWTDPPDTEKWVLELLRAARRTWGVDPNRVYVTGHSMGGYGTWTYGSVHADLFAAGAAFAGAPTVYWKAGRKDREAEGVMDGVLPNLRNLPLFVYQSTDDRNVPCAANQFATAELRKLHDQDPGGWKFVYEEVTGRGHDFPEKGPLPGLEWAVQHVRDPRPRKVVWQPSRDWKTSFYWIRWERPWLGAVLTATVDLPNNAIDVGVRAPRGPDPKAIEAEREARVSALSFLVDERLLDVTREVIVRIDGKERYRGVPAPSLATLVRTAEEREDAEYAIAREIRPAAPAGTR
jgi:dienelactone hydrolase